MAYKSLLTIVSGSKPDLTALDSAVSLARDHDAHLDVICLGVDRTDPGYYFGGATMTLQQASFDQARNEAAGVEAAVRARLGAEDIRWACESAVAQIGMIGSTVGIRARYTDLVVLGRTYGDTALAENEAILEGALFSGRAPVLIVPPGGIPANFSDRIIVAWNEDQEALTAVRAAMPLLATAKLVDVVVVDPSDRSYERSDPGGALSQMLARHGAKTEVSVLARTMPRVADLLVRHARDMNSGLIVMGAYGHSRFREAIIGGATRHMLEMTEVPLFMAH